MPADTLEKCFFPFFLAHIFVLQFQFKIGTNSFPSSRANLILSLWFIGWPVRLAQLAKPLLADLRGQKPAACLFGVVLTRRVEGGGI